MKRTILILGLVIHFTSSYSQVSKWLARDVTGVVRLVDFTTSVPTVSLPAAGYGSGGQEDVNVMTDSNDNILFSTAVYSNNLIEVRDANFQVMPNGNGLLGHESTLESGIVRIPCTTDKYYFIHIDGGPEILYYSTIDMSLNGGLGDVVGKNILLGTNQTEAITISHQMVNGCRWLITGKAVGNTYEVERYLISDAGISSPTTIATVTLPSATVHPHEMELSPDNTKLTMSTMQTTSSATDIVVWDFDLNSGTITNQTDYVLANVPTVLGVEFSPSNEFLYFRSNSSISTSYLGRIHLATGVIDIIDSSMGSFGTQIEAAANGKIYISWNFGGDYLSEIADPNNTNVSNIGFTKNAVLISTSGMRPGIPNAIDGELPGTTVTPQYIAFGAVPTANCNEYFFVDTTCLGTWWEWDFGDGNMSNIQAPIHQYQLNGTYTVTLKTVACGDTLVLTKTNFINANGIPTVTLSSFANVDITTAPVALTGGSPFGGTYSGQGVLNNIFDPSVAGLGTHTIVYSFTDSLGCSGSDSATITVTQQTIVVTLDPFADVCVDETPFALNGGSPAGGMYAGPGVSNGVFDPSMAGVGTHIIVYTFNNLSDTSTITVHALPTVTLSSFANVNITDPAFALTGGSPLGGTYSGPGVANNIFDPSAAGLGTHTIIYNYTDSNGCSNSASATITVTQPVTVTLDPFADVCADAASIALTGGLPAGGTYSGPGVVNGMFDPSTAGVGTHTITYSFAGQTATQTITVNPLPTVTVAVSGGTIGCDNTIIIGAGSQTIITAASVTAVSYQWYHDGNLISGATSSTLIVTQGGTYTAVVTDANGCTSDPNGPGTSVNLNGITANCGNNNNKVVLCHYPPGNNGNPQTLCIAPSAVPAHLANHPGDCLGPCPGQKIASPSAIVEDLHYHISPNPVTDKAEISFMVFEKGNLRIELLDLLGRNIQTIYESFTEADTEHALDLDATRLTQGVYLIRFNTPDGVATEKVTVVK